jgi:geranylgeranyl diphosphate synthase type II
MDGVNKIEQALDEALSRAEASGAPPRLASALRYAVFPGGARIRPRLCLAVAHACGIDDAAPATAAASAIELLHCASLVHDDLPCFDNAATRRGRPSVQAGFGESLAVLVGDALIVGAFEVLGRACTERCELVPALTTLAKATGAGFGLVAGQAWETEPSVALGAYHRAKTGALFEAAVRMGAIAGGGAPDAWSMLGTTMGGAYQLADDILDVSTSERGKPVGQDLRLGRPSAVVELGVDGAHAALRRALGRLPQMVPSAPGATEFRAWLVDVVRSVFAPAQALLSDREASSLSA